MRAINIPLFQTITNKANQRLDFTYNLRDNLNRRYIVSYKNIFTGKNPSLEFDLSKKISDILETENCCSIGGWTDKNTNLYYLDCNKHFFYLKDALNFARLTNQIAIFDSHKKQVLNLKDFENVN
jgi:hypothetical protein